VRWMGRKQVHEWPSQTWLKLGKNRYGTQGAFLPLKHINSETLFEALEGGRD
jgi:hypothetical protein